MSKCHFEVGATKISLKEALSWLDIKIKKGFSKKTPFLFLERLMLLAGDESVGEGDKNAKHGMEWIKDIYTSK
jgi:hypothetical protein